jgi:outer membrane protein assembly factor BamB
MVDVDGDGTKDLVGLFWSAGQEENPLYAAAVDGKTFKLKWSAGPFRSQWNSPRTHLVVAGDKVLVSDTQENLHVLDLATGKELANVRVPDGVVEMCALGDRTHRALVRSAVGTLAERTRIFDAQSAQLSYAPDAMCAPRYDTCYAVNDGHPCFHHGAIPQAPPDARTSPSLYVMRTLQEGTLDIAIATDAGPDGRAPPQAIAFMSGAPKPLWKGSLLADKDTIHFGGVQTELRGGRLVAFYQSKSGPFRLVSREARTGIVAWSSEIPHSQEGSYAAAFGVQDDRVLVVMNQTVHVFDAGTGTRLASLAGQL